MPKTKKFIPEYSKPPIREGTPLHELLRRVAQDVVDRLRSQTKANDGPQLRPFGDLGDRQGKTLPKGDLQ